MDTDTDSNDTDTQRQEEYQRKRLQKKQKHRQQKFRTEWLENPEFKYWLQPVQENHFKAKCKLCHTELVAELQVIRNHSKGAKHQQKEGARATFQSKNITSFFKKANESNSTENPTKRLEIKLCGFLAEHNISFRTIDHLVDVIKSGVPDSKIVQNINLKRVKAAGITRNVIGSTHKNILTKKLRASRFSVLTDESTDISTRKTACINVRFFDKELGLIATQFWELVEVHDVTEADQSVTAEHLYNLIITTFEAQQVPIENIIGFASDGCNVMMGSHNSVTSRFRARCPGIFVMKCICHSLHICASESCKKLPRTCEDLARSIFSYFKYSAKRKSEFVQFQIFCDIEPHQMLHPAQTRWLSLLMVIDRILEQWPALKLYFDEVWIEKKLVSAEQIHKNLNDPYLKLYFLFLQWVLPKFVHANKFFQSEKVVITKLHEIMTETFIDLLCCYMERNYVLTTKLSLINPSEKSKFLNRNSLYLGIKVAEQLGNQNLDRQDLKDFFFEKCTDFLSTACMEIQKRYNFDDVVLKNLRIFVPTVAVAAETRDHTPSLLPLLQSLPRNAKEENWQKIDDEWRKLPFVKLDPNCDSSLECDIFWKNLFQWKNENDDLVFQFLPEFVLSLLSLPHSNAHCERTFSKINLTKTRLRNKLATKTVNGLLHTSDHLKMSGSCVKFEPNSEMLSLMTKDGIYKDSTSENEPDEQVQGLNIE